MRAKKSGYKTGYQKYVDLYKEKERKVGNKYTLSPMLSAENYRLHLDEMKADSLVDKKLGLLSEKTSVNFNRIMINEALYSSSERQAKALRAGLAKYLEDNNIDDISIKNIKLSDLRAKNLKDNKLSGIVDKFWEDVATAREEGMSKTDIGMIFFDSN